MRQLKTVSNSMALEETERDVQKLLGTGRDRERKAAMMGGSERQSATPWDRKDNEKQPATIGDRERHAVTPWH